jgi:hypothetical protein
MAVGDDATAVGYPLVPSTGEEGLVRYGAREINRTRDLVANVKTSLDSRLTGKIERGTSVPSSAYGSNGDIFLVMV